MEVHEQQEFSKGMNPCGIDECRKTDEISLNTVASGDFEAQWECYAIKELSYLDCFRESLISNTLGQSFPVTNRRCRAESYAMPLRTASGSR